MVLRVIHLNNYVFTLLLLNSGIRIESISALMYKLINIIQCAGRMCEISIISHCS